MCNPPLPPSFFLHPPKEEDGSRTIPPREGKPPYGATPELEEDPDPLPATIAVVNVRPGLRFGTPPLRIPNPDTSFRLRVKNHAVREPLTVSNYWPSRCSPATRSL